MYVVKQEIFWKTNHYGKKGSFENVAVLNK